MENNVFDVSAGLDTATDLITWVFDLIAANPILAAVFVAGTLVPCGIALFGNLKHTVK